jgi:hypothetical protein
MCSQEIAQAWARLAIHYGGFMQLIKNTAEWPDPLENMTYAEAIRDPEKHKMITQFMHFTYHVVPESISGMSHFTNASAEDAEDQTATFDV